MLSPTKATREKGSEAGECAISTATDKSRKRRKQNSEIQDSPDPFELIINYFDKQFEGKE